MTHIVKSAFYPDNHAQRDGRVWVREVHDLSDGATREYTYLADKGLDLDKATAARAAAISEELAAQARSAADASQVEAAETSANSAALWAVSKTRLTAAMDVYAKIEDSTWEKDPEGAVARLIVAADEGAA